MLEAFKLQDKDLQREADDAVTLFYEERKKSRHRTKTNQGIELGWFLERGRVLQHGEYLSCSDHTLVKIVAADESVSDVSADGAQKLTQAAYHLGNRHVPLQVGEGYLRYLRDHVLDEMMQALGLQVTHGHKPFQPENGAYAHTGTRARTHDE